MRHSAACGRGGHLWNGTSVDEVQGPRLRPRRRRSSPRAAEPPLGPCVRYPKNSACGFPQREPATCPPQAAGRIPAPWEGRSSYEWRVRTKSVSTPGQFQSCSKSLFMGEKTPNVFAVVFALAATNATVS